MCKTSLFVIPGSVNEGHDSQTRRFGLLGEQSLQHPPLSLRDTSASGE
jgi:hypothetical protein